ncbi:MAG: glycosyltransferase [Proteobacteria bacterium]|nr:glycosyltransferase [Pseudomonadota bacterium]
MRIWIVREGEPLPGGIANGRLMRSGMLATLFAQLGSEVVWWSSTYLHYEKRYAFLSTTVVDVDKNLSLFLLHSKNGYRKNISLKRIRYSKDLGKTFREESKLHQKPDIIYCSWPIIDFAYEAVRYGKEHSIPVVIDIRDLWPDTFIQPFPKLLKPLAKIGINIIFKRKVSYVMQNATVVIGIIPKFLKLAESYGRNLRPQDHVVHHSYNNTPVSDMERQQADSYWKEQGLTQDQCVVSYIGSISNRIGDFDTLLEAARQCDDPSIKFVFCGAGGYLDEVKRLTNGLSNVVLSGYRGRAEIQSLLKLSTFGLLSYRNTDDFIDSLPNKFGEYLSEGLVILTSLKGDSRRILEEEHCGAYYSDAQTLLAAINNLKGNTQLLETMSKNALGLYHREFDASKVYHDFYKFLKSLARDFKKEQGRTVDHA